MTAIGRALLISLLLSGMGVGCEGDSGTVSDDVIEIELWEISYPLEDVMAPIIEAFEEEHPGVRVRARQLSWNNAEQDITMSLASGLPPDVCELGNTWVPRFAAEGVLLDLTDRIGDRRAEYLMWEPGMIGDRIFAMPWVVGTRLLFVNDELMERAGFPSGHVPETWSEMEEAARRIDALEDGIHGIALNAGDPFNPWQKFLPLAYGNGADVLNAEMTAATIDEERMRETLELMVRLREHALIDRAEETDRAFGQGHVGMQISGPWLYRLLPTQYPELRYSSGLIPRSDRPDGTHASFLGGEMLVVFHTTEHPDEAAALAEFICRVDQTLPIVRNMRNVLPAAIEGFSDPLFADDPLLAAFVDQTRLARSVPAHPRWAAIERVVSQMVEETLLTNNPDIPALASRYDRAINLMLSE